MPDAEAGPFSATGIGRMFAIEARMFRAQVGDRAAFDEHALDDVRWLLVRVNEMWTLLPADAQAEFRDRPEDPRHVEGSSSS